MDTVGEPAVSYDVGIVCKLGTTHIDEREYFLFTMMSRPKYMFENKFSSDNDVICTVNQFLFFQQVLGILGHGWGKCINLFVEMKQRVQPSYVLLNLRLIVLLDLEKKLKISFYFG